MAGGIPGAGARAAAGRWRGSEGAARGAGWPCGTVGGGEGKLGRWVVPPPGGCGGSAFLARAPHRTPKRWLNGPISAAAEVGVGERASLKAWAKQGGGDWCSPGWRTASKGYA